MCRKMEKRPLAQGVCSSGEDILKNSGQQRKGKWCPEPWDLEVEPLAQDLPVQATENTRREITGQKL